MLWFAGYLLRTVRELLTCVLDPAYRWGGVMAGEHTECVDINGILCEVPFLWIGSTLILESRGRGIM